MLEKYYELSNRIRRQMCLCLFQTATLEGGVKRREGRRDNHLNMGIVAYIFRVSLLESFDGVALGWKCEK